jgi:hypothetical protein
MQENDFKPIMYMAQHDPAVIAGLLLIGSAAVLFIHIQLKMIRAGYKTSYTFFQKPLGANGWDTPGQYLKVRGKHGWSPWPAYLLGPCVVLGIAIFVLGLFRL